MTPSQQRSAMVILAVVGALHEVYVRQRIVNHVTRPEPARAVQYRAAAQLYRRCALWFGEQALRAEASYYVEIDR